MDVAARAALAAAVAQGAPPRGGGALVTVVVPTTAARAAFHAASYGCFAAQTYAPLELVVVDSGPEPSPFFAGWLCDDRVTYAFARGAKPGPSVGAKRNLAVAAYANGGVLVHFDDDDCYGPRYVETLVAVLRKKRTHAAKLSSWVAVDATRVGRSPVSYYFDGATTGPEAAVFSLGFSLAYTRAAFLATRGFPELSWGEDAAFLRKLRRLYGDRRAVALLRDVEGLCAHVLHPGNRSREHEVAPCATVDATWLATAADVAPLVGPFLGAPKTSVPARSPRARRPRARAAAA